jgi:hypothetical protein
VITAYVVQDHETGGALHKLAAALLGFFLAMTAGTQHVRAQSVTLCFTNNSSYILYMRAFSTSRNAVWPQEGDWALDDRMQHCASLACMPGEQICFGGTNNAGLDWGVGYSKSHGCTACCIACNSTYSWNLTD